MWMRIAISVGALAVALAIAGPPCLVMTGQLRRSTARESNAVKAVAHPDTSDVIPVESAKTEVVYTCRNSGTLIQYPIPDGNAKIIAKAYRRIYDNRPEISITAADPNNLLVYAPPSDQREIEYLLRQQFP
jgi:hypothetical protein